MIPAENPNPISKRRALSGFGWSFLGTTVQSTLHVGVLVVLARALAPADFGTIGTALLLVAFAKVVCRLGIGQAIVQKTDLRDSHLGAGSLLCVFMGGIGCIGFLTTSFVLLRFTEQDLLGNLLLWLTLSPMVFAIGIVPEALLQRALRFQLLAWADIISFVLGYGLVGVGLAWWGFGVWALLAAFWIQLLTRTILLLMCCPEQTWHPFTRQDLTVLLHYGGGQTLAALFNYGAMEGDKFVVTSTLGMSSLGFYGRAYQLAVLPAAILGMVVEKVAFPAFSRMQAAEATLRRTYFQGVQLLLSLFMPATVFLVLYAQTIIELLLGEQWQEVVLPFQILAFSGFFRAGYRFSEAFARAKGAIYQRAWRHGIYGVTMIVASLLGSQFGVQGVALAALIAIVIHYMTVAQLAGDILSISATQLCHAHVKGAATGGVAALIVVAGWLLLQQIDLLPLVEFALLTLITTSTFAYQIYTQLGSHSPQASTPSAEFVPTNKILKRSA